jgi:hypothetical protein
MFTVQDYIQGGYELLPNGPLIHTDKAQWVQTSQSTPLNRSYISFEHQCLSPNPATMIALQNSTGRPVEFKIT